MLARRVNTVYTRGMADKLEDPVMAEVRAWFEASGLSLLDLGLKMGYPPETARQSAWQFMKSGDPRISMLRKFAAAAEMPVEELVNKKKRG
jgi:transcriptional regulator with XRE-family HTH domain